MQINRLLDRLPGVVCCSLLVSLWAGGCSGDKDASQQTSFTKADSLTDRYLQLQDSILYAWNSLVSDDNKKFSSMHELLHELLVRGDHDKDELISMELRLSKVTSLPITQESIDNSALLEEYDFATSTLVTELLGLAESQESFSRSKKLQNIVEEIRLADQRVENNRLQYDAIVREYNRFLERNKNLVKDIDVGNPPEKKPLFQAVSEE